jgi:hypothetical protein
VTTDKKIAIKSTVKVEYDFSYTKGDPDKGFTLEVLNSFPISNMTGGTVTLGLTRELGNTQTNKLQIAIDDEIKVPAGFETAILPNGIGEQSKGLAEEIGHSGNLGHTGIKGPGDRPDETDPDINKLVVLTKENTNVMIQNGKSGSSSTINFLQIFKIFTKVRNDLGKKASTQISKTPIIQQ